MPQQRAFERDEVIVISDTSDDDEPLQTQNRRTPRPQSGLRSVVGARRLNSKRLREERLAQAEEARKFAKTKKRHTATSTDSRKVPLKYKKRPRPVSSGLLLPTANSNMVVPEGVEVMDRPPVLEAEAASPNNVVRRGRGARAYDTVLQWHHPALDPTTLPFSVEEVPAFERGSWLQLCTHRYVVVSVHYPQSPEQEQARAADLKKQLLRLFNLSFWPEGAEPKVSFPRVHGVNKMFIDIRFHTQAQHEKARNPQPVLKLGYDPLVPFIHAAFVGEEYFVLQFAHPTVARRLTDERLKGDEREVVRFGERMLTAVRESRFRAVGRPIALWVAPNDYPHNEDFVPTTGAYKRIPQYTLVLRRSPAQIATGRLPTLPGFVELQSEDDRDGDRDSDGYDDGHAADYGVGGGEYVKVWWDGREDLCNYCKDSCDGHSNLGCHRRTMPNPPRMPPTMY